MLIICGSATSWFQNNLINNHGGLYGRVTYEIKLAPFTLHECEEFYVVTMLNFQDMILFNVIWYLVEFHII